jgi:hypothetical protein
MSFIHHLEQENQEKLAYINAKRTALIQSIISEMERLKNKKGKPYRMLQGQLYRLTHPPEGQI